MKVAVIIDTWFPFVGGGQMNVWEISRRLAKKGVRIDIITRNIGQDNLPKIKNLQIYKLGPKTNPENNFSKIIFIFRSYFFISRRDYNLVNAQAFLPGISAKFLMIVNKIPALLTVHGTSLGTSFNNPLSRSIEKFILTMIRYNAQITVSRDFLEFKNVNRKIYYVPNGVDIKRFDKIKSNKFKNPTLIFVGRLHPQKNLKILISAVEIAKERVPDIRLIIAGDGQLKEELTNIIKINKLQKYIKLLGEVSGKDLIKLYKSSNIFILPSLYEGQPLTLFEAWAAKLPVIVTKSGDCGILVKQNYNGFLLKDIYDPQSAADSLVEAFRHKNLSKIGENGYRLVKDNFSWDQSAELTFRVYRSYSS